jgi:hypothetical protein
VAAYAVYGEVPEATKWAALSRAIYDRVLATYSKDGYYFEGFEYWIFATPWIIHYLDAQCHTTGEDLFDQPGLHESHLYVAHSVTPGGEMMFDFGDVFEGPITRARQGEDYERSHPNGHFETNYNLLYDLAARFHDPQIQGVADWLRGQGQMSQEEWWTLAWRDDSVNPAPMSTVPTYHWFRDHDVAFWRSDWTATATALAFKCGPAEGHTAAALKVKYPEWHFEQGHAHPDVNSFILWAKEAYLTGDSGYAGVPKTIDHNTLLVDGKGQGNEGNGHDAWSKYDYARLNETHIAKADFTATGFVLIGEGAGAYDSSLSLKQFTRQIELLPNTGITINDTIAAKGNHLFSEALHADSSIQQKSDHEFLFKPTGNASARLTPTLRSPSDAKATIEPNIVMGPGIPGSVDKGKLEQRGERVVVTTAHPTHAAHFEWSLLF